jgi:predicted TIM-barrel fold metal-dependent hydrolase
MAMATQQLSKSAAIRARLDHPVIDADAHHLVEDAPALWDTLRQVGGSRLVELYRAHGGFNAHPWDEWRSADARRDRRIMRPPWGDRSTENTRDWATVALPKLLFERMDELGIDFCVVFPTWSMGMRTDDDEVRRAVCRALNIFHAELFRDYAKRVCAPAQIPMRTPQEALEEIEYSVEALGYKLVMLGPVTRPIPAVARGAPEAAGEAFWVDTFGIDSQYDYDPVWAKLAELQVPVATHAGSYYWPNHRSISSYVYNHTGHFAHAAEALCKSLFLGGVTRRFPTLKFSFLEGGVGWACNLYADLIGHWHKRTWAGIDSFNPVHLDRRLLRELTDRYGGRTAAIDLDEVDRRFTAMVQNREEGDEWAASQVHSLEDFRKRFVEPFYFGCEADDPINAWAFNSKVNPLGVKLKAVLGSDIGHWDVPDITEVVAEAHELVEKGLLTEEDFREFTFTNAAEFYGSNPNFFRGTAIEQDVDRLVRVP